MSAETATSTKTCPSCPTLPWCAEHDCCPWDCWDFANDQHKPTAAVAPTTGGDAK